MNIDNPPNEDYPENNEEESDHLAFLPADNVTFQIFPYKILNALGLIAKMASRFDKTIDR